MFPSDASLPTRHWSSSDHAGTDELWAFAAAVRGAVVLLNFAGEMELGWVGGTRQRVRPGTMAWLRNDGEKPLVKAQRLPGKRSECLCIHFPDAWLRSKLGGLETPMPESMRSILLGPAASAAVVVTDLTDADRAWARAWMAPHLCEAARRLLDEARLTEFLFRTAFAQEAAAGNAFQSRTQRLALERVEKVKSILRSSLDEALSLESLARQAGCTGPYLSRTFSEIEGRSISLWFRQVRIERAAELIATGRCNVSEAALEVGYQSLSHFTRAFREEKGVVPSQWIKGR